MHAFLFFYFLFVITRWKTGNDCSNESGVMNASCSTNTPPNDIIVASLETCDWSAFTTTYLKYSDENLTQEWANKQKVANTGTVLTSTINDVVLKIGDFTQQHLYQDLVLLQLESINALGQQVVDKDVCNGWTLQRLLFGRKSHVMVHGFCQPSRPLPMLTEICSAFKKFKCPPRVSRCY
jgi:hypothetical protein